MSPSPSPVTAYFLASDRPKRIPGVCIRGGVVSDINRIPILEKDWLLPIRWDQPATRTYEPVSPTTELANDVAIVDDFRTLEEIHREEERKYGGRTVYDFVTSGYEDEEDGGRKGCW